MPDNSKLNSELLLTVIAESKGLSKLNNELKSNFELGQKAGQALLSLGKVILPGLATAAAVVTKALNATGNSLLKFQLTSGNAATAVNKLQKSYLELSKTIKGSLVSLTDVADLLADFQSGGITQGYLTSLDSFSKSTRLLQESIFKISGKEGSKDVLDFFNSFGDNLDLLNNSTDSLNDQFKELNENLASGNKEKAAASYKKIADSIKYLMLASSNPTSVRKLSNYFETLSQQTSSGLNSSIGTLVKFNEIMTRIQTTTENVLNALSQTFGPGIIKVLDWINEKASSFGDAIQKWINDGGLEKVKLTFIDICSSVVDISNKIGSIINFLSLDWTKSSSDRANDIPKEKFSKRHVQDLSKSFHDFAINLSKTTIAAGSTSPSIQKTLDPVQQLITKISFLTASTNRLNQFTNSISDLSNAMMQLGPNSGFNKFINDNLGDTLNQINIQLGESVKSLEEWRDVYNNASDPQQRVAAYGKIQEITSNINNLLSNMNKLSEANLGSLKAEASRIELIKNLRSEDLRISQALYGTPALAVQSQLEIVKALEMQKQNLIQQDKVQADFIEKQKKIAAETADPSVQKIALEALFGAENKRLEINLKIKQIMAEQLETAKELRDGYLDAVQASAFGARAFEKIIITQEKNLGAALEARTVKQNFLLGSNKSVSNVSSYRFTDQGYGVLAKADGSAFGRNEMNQRMIQAANSVNDPTQRAAILQSSKLVLDAYKYTADVQKQTTNQQIDALIKNTDAINSFATATAQATGHLSGLKGNAATTFEGEAARTALNNTGSTTTTASNPSMNFSQKLNKVSQMLNESGKLIKEIGPVIDELTHQSQSGGSAATKGGNFILSGINY